MNLTGAIRAGYGGHDEPREPASSSPHPETEKKKRKHNVVSVQILLFDELTILLFAYISQTKARTKEAIPSGNIHI